MLVGAYNVIDVASRHTTTERASYDGVRSLVIEDASDVRLTGAPAGTPLEVVTRVTEGLRTPERSVERGAGGELRLESSCPGFFGGQCSVDYDDQRAAPAPSSTPTPTPATSSPSGSTTTEPLVLESSAGDVTAIDVKAPSIELSSSAGDVEARGLSAERVEPTRRRATWSRRSEPARRLVAESSAGDVELLVPDVVYDLTRAARRRRRRARGERPRLAARDHRALERGRRAGGRAPLTRDECHLEPA